MGAHENTLLFNFLFYFSNLCTNWFINAQIWFIVFLICCCIGIIIGVEIGVLGQLSHPHA